MAVSLWLHSCRFCDRGSVYTLKAASVKTSCLCHYVSVYILHVCNHPHFSWSLCLLPVWVQLKSDMAAGFGEALQRKLLEVEGLYSQVRSRYTFIQALVRRIRGLLRQPKSWGEKHQNTKTGQDRNTLYAEWKPLPSNTAKLSSQPLPALGLLFPLEYCGVETQGAFCVTNPNYVWLTPREENSSKKWEKERKCTTRIIFLHVWNSVCWFLFCENKRFLYLLNTWCFMASCMSRLFKYRFNWARF